MGTELGDQERLIFSVPDNEKKERGGGNEGRPSRRSYTEQFEEVCPWYMAIGMSRDEFWNGDPWAARDYRKAYEFQREIRNYELWLQGRYIYEAVADLSPILRAFSKAKKPIPYPNEPYTLRTSISKKRQEHNEREQQREQMLLEKEKFLSFAREFNRQFKKKQENSQPKEVTPDAGQRTDAGD